MPKLTFKLVLILAAAAIAILLVAVGPSACTSFFTAKKEAELSKGNAKASIAAGAEAMNTVSNVQAQEAETRKTVKEGVDAINSAPAGDSNDAADRAVCELRSYRHLERCARLRSAGPPDPARSGGAR